MSFRQQTACDSLVVRSRITWKSFPSRRVRSESMMLRRLFAAPAILAVLVSLVGCQSLANDRLRESVVQGSSHGGPAAALENAGITASGICVFDSGTSREEIDAAMGFAWSEAPSIPQSTELVVAIAPPKVVAWASVPAGSTGTLVPTHFGCGPAS